MRIGGSANHPNHFQYGGTPVDLDRKDFALIEALQEDAAQRLEDLGRRVGMAASSVHGRLQRLEGSGIIRRWTVECDAAALGLPVLAYVGVRATRPCAEFAHALRAVSAVEECHSVAGGFSMLLKVRVASPPDLLSLVEELRQIPGVEGTETTVVLATEFTRPFHARYPEPTRRSRRSGERESGTAPQRG